MKLLLLALLASPAPASAGETAAATVPSTAASTSGRAVAASGLEITADLHDEYLAGFPMLVEITVSNKTAQVLQFPDLSARPHLVRFQLRLADRRTERFTTPPAVDAGAAWTLAPGSQRRVMLEIPSSSGFALGTGTLALQILDPLGTLDLDPRPIRIATAQPVGGTIVHEPTISATSGAMVAWLHRATSGFELYLLQLNPRAPTRALAQYRLAHLDAAVEPVLSRSRPADALARYIYWQAGPQTYALGRLEGSAFPERPTTVSVPWPRSEPLARGGTDGAGGLIVPLWIPAPKGSAGSVKALCVNKRGGVVVREVADLPARPRFAATAVDAAGNLLLAVGHAAALDLYKVDPTAAAKLPARGERVAKLADGWAAAAVAFETLPDQADRAGGLSMLSVLQRRQEDGSVVYRSLWSDIAGKVFRESAALPWTAPGEITTLLPGGLGPFYYLTRDTAGASWYGAQGAAAVQIAPKGPGTLWATAEAVQLRRLVPGTVIDDQPVGPRAP